MTLYLNYEFEQINNLDFEKNSISISHLLWINASYKI